MSSLIHIGYGYVCLCRLAMSITVFSF